MPAPAVPALVTRWSNYLDISGSAVETTWEEVFAELRSPGSFSRDEDYPGWSPIKCVPPLREDKNVQAVSALTLDYDGTAGIESALELWGGFYGLLHTTRKHTPDVHRFRIVLPLSRYVNVAEYARLWAWAHDRCARAGQRIDVSTKNPSRFWYLPGTKPGGAFAVVDLNGAPLDVDAVLAEFDARTKTNAQPPTPGALPGQSLFERMKRARAYIAKMDPAISGQGGHAATWAVALVLVRGFDLPTGVALDILAHEYNPRCQPPWSMRELEHKASSAERAGKLPTGYLVEDDRREWRSYAEAPSDADSSEHGDAWEPPETEPPSAEEPQPEAPKPKTGFQFLTLEELCAPLEPVNYVVEALDMCPGRPTQIAGTGFAGKTICAQSMVMSIIAGRRVWGEFWCRQGAAVHLDYEMGKRATLRRYRRLCAGAGLSWDGQVAPWLRLAPLPRLYLNTKGVEDYLKAATEGATIALIDSLRRALPGEEENDSSITEYIDALPRVSEATGCSFIFLHHSTTKSKSLEGQDSRGAGRGTSAIYDSSGAVLFMSGKRGQPVLVEQTKAPERGTACEDFMLHIEDVEIDGEPNAGVRVRYEAKDGAESATEVPPLESDCARVVTYIRSENEQGRGVAGKDAVASGAGMKRSSAGAAVDTLIARCVVEDRPDGRKPRLWVKR